MKIRPTISIYIAVSIDGYIARKNGELDWLDRVGGYDEDYGFQQFLNSVDTVVLGRKTYEVAITVPDPYPAKKVIVLSNSLTSVREGMTLYRGDLIELVITLQKENVKHIWVDGGAVLSQFLSLQMVDQMMLSIIPVILANGVPLFHRVDKEIPCRLLSSQSYPSGLVQLHYEIIHQFSEITDKIYFTIVDYGSDEYKKSVALREAVLRKPLGLIFTEEELSLEEKHIHIAGFLGQELCATAVLVPKKNELKMQRVAIKKELQDKGIGSALTAFCEEYAKQHGYHAIYCHARGTAIPFYLKNQYLLEGDPFNEDGIPHHIMRKRL